MPRIGELRQDATAALRRAGVAEPALTAELLLARALGHPRGYLYAHAGDPAAPDAAARLAAWLERRAAGEPLQYITGVQEFYGREFCVTPAALIPRPETEMLVTAALERIPPTQAARVVDVATGSGCIAVTLALERPAARVIATDISRPALDLARANARRLHAPVEFLQTDLLAAASGPFDLILANPPYVAEADLPGLAREVRDHEPHLALVAGPRGTEIYARLIPQAAGRLRPGGWLLLELGYASAAAVRQLLGPEWRDVETRSDLQGWERLLLARLASQGPAPTTESE